MYHDDHRDHHDDDDDHWASSGVHGELQEAMSDQFQAASL